MEEMKRVILDGEETPFMITKNGMLYREDTGNWYKPFENSGYLSYHLKWKNRTYPKRIHRLVAEAYIPNPENKPFVHHKDHNRYNNSVENLEWATVEENNNDKLKREKQQIVDYSKYDYEDEEWKQYLDTQFYVSNLGRVKNILTKNILKGNIRENGYLRVGLRIGKKITSFNVHNLVWLVWKGKQNGVINHINGDKLDNRLINLEDISQSENILKACYETKTKKTIPVGQYNDNNELIKIYQSQVQAEKELKLLRGSVSRAISNGGKTGGFYWKKIIE